MDGRSKVGQWVSFDPDTKDGHCIYWPEKRSVSVERSVKFNFNDETMVKILPLEGEIPNSTINKPRTLEEQSDAPTEHIEEPTDVVQQPEPTEGRGKRIRTKSRYVRLLKEGAGITGKRLGTLSKGMQTGSRVEDVGDVEDVVKEHAMATVVESVEGLTPTYNEARRRLDWPKWKEAIEKELDSLKKSNTWELVGRPSGANMVDCRWVLRIKKNVAGKIEKYKARLVEVFSLPHFFWSDSGRTGTGILILIFG